MVKTFLQYVCERLLGPPEKHGGREGDSYWLCPFHGDTDPSFHTLPSQPGLKDRWRCFGCGMRGDEADLMKELIPGELWPRRRARLEQWRREYEREQEVDGASNSPRGRGEEEAKQPRGKGRVGEAWANFREILRDEETSDAFALQILKEASQCCESANTTVEDLIDYWQRFEDWIAETDRLHLEECDDSDCDAIVCRAARGLPPLFQSGCRR